MPVLGIDTSNYTTSVAVFDGHGGMNAGRLLSVRPGELGLRQSDALFQHVRQLPELFERLAGENLLHDLEAVGASTRPRAVEGSYMPCFLAGTSQGRNLASTLGVPFFAHSHQQGHLAAAAWSAGCLELLDKPFLAWHLSGGTTELLKVEPEKYTVTAEIVGGTSDISAGQIMDRTGKLLSLTFPAGKEMDRLSQESDCKDRFKVKTADLQFSLSGLENKIAQYREAGHEPADVAAYAVSSVCDVVVRTTRDALKQYPDFPVVFSGGVASNSMLRQKTQCLHPIFAEPRFSTDNAMGIAVLTWLQEGTAPWNET